MSTPLVITPIEIEKFKALKAYALKNPIDMREVEEMVKTPAGLRRHIDRMSVYTVEMPFGFTVTFSVERGHNIDTLCWHLSMASPNPNRLPTPEAVKMVAEHFGFTGDLQNWAVWIENLKDGGKAINVVQPSAVKI